jgi:hypothetical protein
MVVERWISVALDIEIHGDRRERQLQHCCSTVAPCHIHLYPFPLGFLLVEMGEPMEPTGRARCWDIMYPDVADDLLSVAISRS